MAWLMFHIGYSSGTTETLPKGGPTMFVNTSPGMVNDFLIFVSW